MDLTSAEVSGALSSPFFLKGVRVPRVFKELLKLRSIRMRRHFQSVILKR
jgi:hypothetical protein